MSSMSFNDNRVYDYNLTTLTTDQEIAKKDVLNLLCRVPNQDLRHAIQERMTRLMLDWDQNIHRLQQCEEALIKEHTHLIYAEEKSHQHYEKAVREMKFFKSQYSLERSKYDSDRRLTVYIDTHDSQSKKIQHSMDTITEISSDPSGSSPTLPYGTT